jgi:hypothetical protein
MINDKNADAELSFFPVSSMALYGNNQQKLAKYVSDGYIFFRAEVVRPEFRPGGHIGGDQ